MEAEHGEIDPLLEACAAGFARMAAGADDGRPGRARRPARRGPGVASAGTSRHEETDAIALLQRVTDPGGVGGDRAEHFKEGMTFGQFAVRLVPWVLHEVPADVREHALRQRRAARTGDLAAHPPPVRAARAAGVPPRAALTPTAQKP